MKLLLTLICLCTSFLSNLVYGQATGAAGYPTRPIRIIVPYAAGGGVDQMARTVGERLQRQIGQAVIIENRPGGSTSLGTGLVAAAQPDGYTLLMATTPLVVNPSIKKNLSFNTETDLIPVLLVATYPTLLVVHPSLPVHNVKELIDYAKANPGKLNYGSVGAGSSTHLAAELFKDTASLDMAHIPYNGSTPASVDLLSGRIQLMFATMITALPYAQDGKLRALAVSTPNRSPAAPNIPTVAETGLPGFDVTSFYGLMAPKGTPEAIIQKLRDIVAQEMLKPEVVAQFKKEGVEIVASQTSEFDAFLKREYKKWAHVVKVAGITEN